MLFGKVDREMAMVKNELAVIDLSQGMFDKRIQQCYARWVQKAHLLAEVTNVREIQCGLKASGISLLAEVDETTIGSPSTMLSDPEGNTTLIDQHV